VFNGLLLGAAYDAAFDAGLITFKIDGQIAISEMLGNEQRQAAGLDAAATLRSITQQHQEYLYYHRSAATPAAAPIPTISRRVSVLIRNLSAGEALQRDVR
jgi:hypothetical protein